MNSNLLNIIKQITAGYGEGILADPARLKAFFSDLARDEPKPLRIAFGRCIEAGAYAALKNAPDATERAEHKAVITQRVRDEHGLDPALCGEALAILEAALFAERKEPPKCAKCDAELGEGWKACPYCGAAAKQAETPATSSDDTLFQPTSTAPVTAPPIPHITSQNPVKRAQPSGVSNYDALVIVTLVIGSVIGAVIGAVSGYYGNGYVVSDGAVGGGLGFCVGLLVVAWKARTKP
jgi:hypothetical protein